MLDVGTLTTVGAAFAVGLATGAHCVAMCGPIGCALLGRPGGSRAELFVGFGGYHLGRVMAYSLWGSAAGAVGARALEGLGEGLARLAPWAMVTLILVAILRWDRLVPKSKTLGRWYLQASASVRKWPAGSRGLGLGLITPLLPCGPLYLLLTAAMFTADAGRGALFGIAFALGTIPLLALGQTAFLALGRKLPPKALRSVQIAVSLLAVGVISWRALSTDTIGAGICAF